MTNCVHQPKIALLKTRLPKFLVIAIAILTSGTTVCAASNEPRHIVLVVWDGMRPDFVTKKYAPVLEKLARDGVRFRNHHAVYPTATDVNGAALATGCYPNRNGLFANTEFRPTINPRQPIDTGDPDSIRRGDEISGGKYLAVPTFVELLRAAGKKVALVGTKSVALLFDRHNEWTIVKAQDKPLTIFAGAPIGNSQRDELTKIVGPFPNQPNATAAQRNNFATRVLTEFLWRNGVPDFSLLWLSEPDLSEHNFAPGSQQAIAAIKAVDDNLATVLSALDKKQLRDSTDIFVVSDHGFSTIRRSIDVIEMLNKAGFHAAKELSDSSKSGDILVCGNGGTVLFYVCDHDREVKQRLVNWLQHGDFTGVIFTREKLQGTFTFDAVRIDTQNAADVVMSFRWYDKKNQFGVAGMIDADWNRKAGQGTHATLSPCDVHNTLIAAGPDFGLNYDNDKPSGNVDIAATVSDIFNLRMQTLDGRNLVQLGRDAFREPPLAEQTHTLEASHDFPDGRWEQTLSISRCSTTDFFGDGNGAFTKK